MSTFRPPLDDMKFVIDELVNLDSLLSLERFNEIDRDLISSILEEAGRLAVEVIEPCNAAGDEEGAQLKGDDVHAAAGFNKAYQTLVEGGWPSLAFNPEYDGQGLPSLLSFAVDEMINSANMSFAICPMLTQAAVEALDKHGSDELKTAYLANMISGRWCGAMDLTEPQAGSNLAALRCQATVEGDHYRIKGNKIFISWGDHAMAENIIHLVLARLEGAPEGVKGISLFLVPKFLTDESGQIGARNDVRAVSLEHKMGIHGSPTCVMEFGAQDGAVGFLVGEPNQGLKCMFTMMNNARLKVGLEGVGLSQRAYQHAREYALERVQGRPPGGTDASPIAGHPDVRRMLMLQKSITQAMRIMAYSTAVHSDLAEHSDNEDTRRSHHQRVAVMVPLVKAWCTELCQEVTSLGIQVFGGMGYVEETGAAQYYRDARIITIYEGTTGIQAQDLVGRKIIRDSGKAINELAAEVTDTVSALRQSGMDHEAQQLQDGLQHMTDAVSWLLANYANDQYAPNAVAYNLLMTCGTVIAAWGMARSLLTATKKLEADSAGKSFLQSQQITARFFLDNVLPRASAFHQAVVAGSHNIMALSDQQL